MYMCPSTLVWHNECERERSGAGLFLRGTPVSGGRCWLCWGPTPHRMQLRTTHATDHV